jgi:hypothetical protein
VAGLVAERVHDREDPVLARSASPRARPLPRVGDDHAGSYSEIGATQLSRPVVREIALAATMYGRGHRY